jgi:hypothetical protein
MKLIIVDGIAVAAVNDDYQPGGFEQDIVDAPVGFDPAQLGSYVYLGKTLADAQAALLAQLEPMRLQIMNQGLQYQFADGPGLIQTRDPSKFPDLLNINGIYSMAMIAQAAGLAQMPNGFIDEANDVHQLTPAQAITMAQAVGAFVSNMTFYKKTLRAQIAALQTFEDAQAFDLSAGWPTQ